MKKLLIIVTLILCILPINAEYKREGDTFKSEKTLLESSEPKTKYTWEDKEGNKYPVYMTKNRCFYILRTSKKTGKEYKQYLPKEVQEQIRKELNK